MSQLETKFYKKIMPQFNEKQISDWLSYSRAIKRLAKLRKNYELVSVDFEKVDEKIIQGEFEKYKMILQNISQATKNISKEMEGKI